MKAVVSAALVATAEAANTFVSIGDWGGAALGDSQYAKNVADVASAMESVASAASAQFVIGTGDNFYWCGITSTSDFQVETDWVDPYTGYLDEIKWYHALGNHEYGYDVESQIDLANSYENWVMDDRYFTKRLEIGDTGAYVTMIFIDTSPCVQEYRSESNSGWDPCGAEYPTCSLSTNDDDFEGTCQFHANILGQDCQTQLTWFAKELAAVPTDDWLLIVGHHPADEIDVEDFASLMQDHGFDLYVNGHAHTLTQYTVDNAGAYVTTGAGSMVDTVDQGHLKVAPKLLGLNISSSSSSSGHSYQSIWNQKVAGFTLHTFSDDLTQLTTDYYDYSGAVVNSFTVTKRTVADDDTAPSTDDDSKCCHFDDATCNTGDVCCYSNCDDPASCSYSQGGCSGQYGQIHDCQWDGSTCTVQSSTTHIVAPAIATA